MRRCARPNLAWLVVASLAGAAMSGCSSGLSGEYGGDNCLYEMNFRPDGAVYIKFMGMEVAGQYKIDGDKVAVGAPGKEMLVFTRNGDTLEAGFMGEKMECKKK